MDIGLVMHPTIFSVTYAFLDSPAFDAKTYYEQMITVSSLQVLLKRDNDLVSGPCLFILRYEQFIQKNAEIRQLESDRQALVYNHHHELIAASDTIRAVRDSEIMLIRSSR